jgi:DNA-binding protein HU-beta
MNCQNEGSDRHFHLLVLTEISHNSPLFSRSETIFELNPIPNAQSASCGSLVDPLFRLTNKKDVQIFELFNPRTLLHRDQVPLGINKRRFSSPNHHLEGEQMTKADLVSKIVSDVGITKSQAEKAMDGFVSAVSGAPATGDRITLVGFGTFSVAARTQREGRNAATGEKIKIPASKTVKFKAGKTLSEKVK